MPVCIHDNHSFISRQKSFIWHNEFYYSDKQWQYTFGSLTDFGKPAIYTDYFGLISKLKLDHYNAGYDILDVCKVLVQIWFAKCKTKIDI